MTAYSFDFGVHFGDRVRDKKTGAVGKVTTLQACEDGRSGVWLTGIDSTGRPFDAYVAHADIEPITT